jgi:hypothetical protein
VDEALLEAAVLAIVPEEGPRTWIRSQIPGMLRLNLSDWIETARPMTYEPSFEFSYSGVFLFQSLYLLLLLLFGTLQLRIEMAERVGDNG